jgi:hypothetical protein
MLQHLNSQPASNLLSFPITLLKNSIRHTPFRALPSIRRIANASENYDGQASILQRTDYLPSLVEGDLI